MNFFKYFKILQKKLMKKNARSRKFIHSNKFELNRFKQRNKNKNKINLKIKSVPKKLLTKIFLLLSFSLNLFLLKYLLFKKVKKEIINPIKILPREEALDRGLPFVKKCLDGILMKKIDIKEKILNPKISVVIPCYNCKKYIKSALRSVQNQNMTDIEIIIQNDDSNNETVNLLNELLKEDPRIEILYNVNIF